MSWFSCFLTFVFGIFVRASMYPHSYRLDKNSMLQDVQYFFLFLFNQLGLCGIYWEILKWWCHKGGKILWKLSQTTLIWLLTLCIYKMTFSSNIENPVEYRLVGFTSYSVCVCVCVSTFVTSFFSFSPLSISSPSRFIELHLGLPHCRGGQRWQRDGEIGKMRLAWWDCYGEIVTARLWCRDGDWEMVMASWW